MKILRKHAYAALLTVLALAVLADYAWLDFGRVVDERMGDLVLRRHAAQRPASPDIVVIDIDQKSLEEMNEVAGSWPWPRAIHGELLSGILQQQPQAVVFDLFLNETDTFRPDSDAVLADVLRASANVYLPTVLLGDGLGAPLGQLPPQLGLMRTPKAQADARAPLLLPLAMPMESWRGGLVNFDMDGDGIGRRYGLYRELAGWRLPSMPARLAQDFGWTIPPVDKFRLNWHSARQHVSYADLYLDFNREKPQRPQDEFTGKIVVIGSAAPGLQDLRPTVMSKVYPGVDILASAIDNLKHGDWLRGPARGGFALLALALGGLLYLGFRRGINTLSLAGFMLLATLAAWAAFRLGLAQLQYWPLAMALVWGWVYFWLAALAAYLIEKARGAQAVALFGRFLDARVVKDLVASGEINPQQEAQSREITVLFSDIRGFTTLSETRSPEYIVGLLNRYFTRQVEVIFRHGGTLDKFIGDAIMAFWGAPVHDPEHARHAVAAALEMSQVLEEFKAELAGEGIDFDVGIGIHTGNAVVGFIGAEARLDYTVIGDTVNLASRIEGLTKGVARVLVSDATRAACQNDFEFVAHGSQQVKGRAEAVALFEPKTKDSA